MFTPNNPNGNLTLVTHAAGRTSTNTGGSVWRTIPGMSGVSWIQPGENLEVEVAATISSSTDVWVRVLIDGVPANPAHALFASGTHLASRSFRFVASGLSSGARIIEAQWIGDPNAVISDHNLTAHSASPTAGLGRLAVAAPVLGPTLSTTSTAWTDIPGLSTTFTAPAAGAAAIHFSAVSAIGLLGKFRVRAVVDGVALNEIELHSSGYAARSYQFVAQVTPGAHTVSIQWSTPSGSISIGARSLTVFSSASVNPGGTFVAEEAVATATPIGVGWTEIGRMIPPNSDAGAVAAVQVSVEATSPSPLSLRARVNGTVIGPSDVLLTSSSPGYGAHTYTFHVKDLQPFLYSVIIEARTATGIAIIRDRSIVVTTKRRHGADFAQPTIGFDPDLDIRPRHGQINHLVLCLDAKRSLDGNSGSGPVARAFTMPELTAIFAGGDGRKNLADWLVEQSRGKLVIGTQIINPCRTTTRPQDWYWQGTEEEQRFLTMHRDALILADADINFLQFDTNGDRVLSFDEVVITIVKPQKGLFGQYGKSATLYLDGTQLTVPYLDVYMEPPGTVVNADPRVANVGVAAHELAHAFGALDLPTGDAFTTMSAAGYAGHLDPLHKLMLGWLVPDAVEWESLWNNPLSFSLRASPVAGEALLVYDRARPGERLLIEHRWPDPSNYDGFDSPLGIGSGGVVAWRLRFNPVTRAWDPGPIVREPYVMWGPITPLEVFWSDNTKALTISSILTTTPSPTMNVMVSRP